MLQAMNGLLAGVSLDSATMSEDSQATIDQESSNSTIQQAATRGGTVTQMASGSMATGADRKVNWLPWLAGVGGITIFCLIILLAGVVWWSANQYASPVATEPASSSGNWSPTSTPRNPVSESPVVTIDPVLPTAIPATETTVIINFPTEKPAPLSTTFQIGTSVEGRSINGLRLGSGPQVIVLSASLHGSEKNTVDLVQRLADTFTNNPTIVPDSVSLYFVFSPNPDGFSVGRRYNSHGVDLNRNWATENWTIDTIYGEQLVSGGGGITPFSEPESLAYSNWLLGLQSQTSQKILVIIYESSYGSVQPGYRLSNGVSQLDGTSDTIARQLANSLNYRYIQAWTAYTITGEAINWCGDQGMASINIELPTSDNLTTDEVNTHFNAITQLFNP
jgi:hypothetical protein